MKTLSAQSDTVRKAASKFGRGTFNIAPLGNGLIHETFVVTYADSPPVVLQCINQHSFAQPENIIRNYVRIINHLAGKTSVVAIPALQQTQDGHLFFRDENLEDETERFWRATSFIANCYTHSTVASATMAKTAAAAYAKFTVSLEGLDPVDWNYAIPSFHHLATRYAQFERAIHTATLFRLMKATHLIATLREKYAYVELSERVAQDETDYPTRFMHHDCKLNNILFDSSGNAVAVVDLDTVMPGKFFSDLGDMVRTMACTEDEESRQWEKIDVVPGYHKAILDGYREEMGARLTPAETEHLPHAGLLITYMQTLRYATDYLNNDIYYKTMEPDHNLYRAFNQLILLEKLETLTQVAPN